MDITQGAPFESFGLSEATMRAIQNKGYEVSTPVQAGCIPPMLAGKDVIAKAPTGTGLRVPGLLGRRLRLRRRHHRPHDGTLYHGAGRGRQRRA